jgi:hypothetical protein
VDSLSRTLASTTSATSSDPETTENEETIWFVVKYRIGDPGPYSVFVRASKSEQSAAVTIDPPKDLVDRANARKKERGTTDDSIVEPDGSDSNRVRIPSFIKHLDLLKYRLELPESDRIF